MAEKKIGRRIPWWGYLLMAILSYSILKYGVPRLSGAGDGIAPLMALVAKGAPLAAIVFLLLAANALYSDSPPDEGDNPSEKNGQ